MSRVFDGNIEATELLLHVILEGEAVAIDGCGSGGSTQYEFSVPFDFTDEFSVIEYERFNKSMNQYLTSIELRMYP